MKWIGEQRRLLVERLAVVRKVQVKVVDRSRITFSVLSRTFCWKSKTPHQTRIVACVRPMVTGPWRDCYQRHHQRSLSIPFRWYHRLEMRVTCHESTGQHSSCASPVLVYALQRHVDGVGTFMVHQRPGPRIFRYVFFFPLI